MTKITFRNGQAPAINDTNLNQLQDNTEEAISDLRAEIKSEILSEVYPIGCYYWSSESTDPGTLFGGTWQRVKDKFILALGDTGNAGDTGGVSTVTLTRNNLPLISGSFTMHGAGSSTPVSSVSGDFKTDYNNTKYKNGGTEVTGANSVGNVKISVGKSSPDALNNLPPYEKAYCWKRTA